MRLVYATIISVFLTFQFQVNAQSQYPRIVGDISIGIGAQFETALGDFSEFAGSGLGFSGIIEYALAPYWVTNFIFSSQTFSGTSPETIIVSGEVFTEDELDASNSVNSFFLGTRFYSHSRAKIQFFLGGKIGLERISSKLESTDPIDDVQTTISEEKKYRLGLSPEFGVRYNNFLNVAGIYSAFSDGSYWGIRTGIAFSLRRW